MSVRYSRKKLNLQLAMFLVVLRIPLEANQKGISGLAYRVLVVLDRDRSHVLVE